jgi:hypothetical protein
VASERPAPKAFIERFQLLRLLPYTTDALKKAERAQLPVAAYSPGSERRPSGGFERLTVVPSADIRGGCSADGQGPGACLLVEARSRVRCFTVPEIEAGCAFALAGVKTGGARLVGFVPDGVSRAELVADGVRVVIPVYDNVVDGYVQRLRPGAPACWSSSGATVCDSVHAYAAT